MDIIFTGKYKSITSFDWIDIPEFVVITGTNGSGKSQLLNLIYNTVTNKKDTFERVGIAGKFFKSDEVFFLKGEWELQSPMDVDLAFIQQLSSSRYQHFLQNQHDYQHNNQEHNFRINAAYRGVLEKSGKNIVSQINKDEFIKHFPEFLIEQESQIGQKIGEIFYNYRLTELEFQAKYYSEEAIKEKIGEKPWVVLRQIIRASKLPFTINDPSEHGFRDSFKLTLTHDTLKEVVGFNDLSSGEKVLMSLVFYLYNSQEKKIFPKLLLLDEPDAHLHPSMSQQFLNVIKNVLVDQYHVQVIMTTHSPSTVILAPEEFIFEMSKDEPRIKKTSSKNHAVSLLTAGLVYVGTGTKYFLVEDVDDVNFYSYVYNQLMLSGEINSDIPLVFIPASTNTKSGGKDVVQGWVKKLKDSGLTGVVQGLIDADSGNIMSSGVFKIKRYSFENYLIDPILVYAVLLDKERNPSVTGVNLSLGEEYKLKLLSDEHLQLIATTVFAQIEPELRSYFADYNPLVENIKVEVEFLGGIKLQYPKWLIERRGKTLLHEVYNKVYTSPIINATTLFKALKKINMFPNELLETFVTLRDSATD